MSDKTYTEDDIVRLGGVISENIISQFKTGFEAIESMQKDVAKIPAIESAVSDLQTDMKTVKAAAKATNQDLKATRQELQELREDVADLDETVFELDRAVGNVEHKVDAIYTFSSLAYGKSEEKSKAFQKQISNLDRRLTKVEAGNCS